MRRSDLPRQMIAQADAMRDTGNAAAAAVLYQQAISLGDGRHGIRKQLANMLKDSGQYQAAAYQYHRCLEQDPGNGDTFLQLGHLHKLQGDYGVAEEFYSKASEHMSTAEYARAELETLEKLSRERAAAKEPEHVVPLDPAMTELIRVVHELGQRMDDLSGHPALAGPDPAMTELMRVVHDLGQRTDDLGRHPVLAGPDPAIAELARMVQDLGQRTDGLARHPTLTGPDPAMGELRRMVLLLEQRVEGRPGPDPAVAELTRVVQELGRRVDHLPGQIMGGLAIPAGERVAMEEIRNNWYSLLPMLLNTAATIAELGANVGALTARVRVLEARQHEASHGSQVPEDREFGSRGTAGHLGKGD